MCWDVQSVGGGQADWLTGLLAALYVVNNNAAVGAAAG